VALKHSFALVNILGKERDELIGMGAEGVTKALPETVETSQLGSHGSGQKSEMNRARMDWREVFDSRSFRKTYPMVR
jgi:hypothetical protein